MENLERSIPKRFRTAMVSIPAMGKVALALNFRF
jgi:hypothetical protein